ncbi:hypothetical protein N9B90_01560 [bacterium]|nr:hypothetical protein [bacterium]
MDRMNIWFVRNARWILGGCGGVVGAIVSQLNPVEGESWLGVVFETVLWFGISMALVSLALVWGVGIYQRRFKFPRELAVNMLIGGGLAGGVGGGVAQAVFGSISFESLLSVQLFKASCWGLAGGIVGALFCKVVPNMTSVRGAVGGALGGSVGGALFVSLGELLPLVGGHIVGIGVLGASMGLALSLADRLYRKAWLEVVWAPSETTTVALGEQPVRIGGGDDHVFIYSLPAGAMKIVIEGGEIVLIRAPGERKTILKDGSSIAVDGIKIGVHTKS